MGNSCSGKPAAVPRDPAPAAAPPPHDEPARRRAPQRGGGRGRPSVATKRMSDVSELTESDVSEQSEWDALLAQPAEETAVRVAIRSGRRSTASRPLHPRQPRFCRRHGLRALRRDARRPHSTQKATYDGVARNVVEQALEVFTGASWPTAPLVPERPMPWLVKEATRASCLVRSPRSSP